MENEPFPKDYGELNKYFEMLRAGNAIAVRLHEEIISEHTAKILFARMVTDLTDAALRDRNRR